MQQPGACRRAGSGSSRCSALGALLLVLVASRASARPYAWRLHGDEEDVAAIPSAAVLAHAHQTAAGPKLSGRTRSLLADGPPLRVPDFWIVGQQKCGTSTLAVNLVEHPLIKGLSMKEPAYWQWENGVANCDGELKKYLQLFGERASQLPAPATGGGQEAYRLGDFSTTYFACACCPQMAVTLNPNIKVVVALRDPIKRTLSRFMEQARNPGFAHHERTRGFTFLNFTRSQIGELQACLADAAAQLPPGPGGERLRELWEWQCYQRSNFVGWSAYHVFLKRWIAALPNPRTQLLVVYTEDLAAQPLATLRAVESFLGLADKPHAYAQERLHQVFNSRQCYHWLCSKQRSEALAPHNATLSEGADGDEQDDHGTAPASSANSAAAGRAARMSPQLKEIVDFFKPHMRELFKLAEQGLIAKLPDVYLKRYT